MPPNGRWSLTLRQFLSGELLRRGWVGSNLANARSDFKRLSLGL